MSNRYRPAYVAAVAGCVAVLFAVATPAQAQNEANLKSFFEGRRVTLRMDMPGSADGVDVRIEGPERGIDFKSYREDLRRYGTALHAGDTITVTLIKLKKDLVEFQLGGGGFGTWGDDTSTSSNIPLIDKSEREKQLEKRIREESDRERKRSLERELDDIRDRRERENRRLRLERERIEAIKRERIAADRLRGGSRFNLRYADRVPVSLSPEQIVAALSDYVDFANRDDRSGPPVGDISIVRKGLLRQDAERAFGRPVEESQKREGGIVSTTLVFDVRDQRITAVFVEDVLIRYTIASR